VGNNGAAHLTTARARGQTVGAAQPCGGCLPGWGWGPGLGSQSFLEPGPEADHVVGQLTHVFISQRALWVLLFPPFWNRPINAAVVSLRKF
jgi:hypothetical protein